MYPDPAVRKVLIYRVGSLGDTIVALPSFHLIARAFPNAERVLLSENPQHAKATPASALLKGAGLIHGDMRYPGATRNLGDILRTLLEIRRYRPDVVVHLMPRFSAKATRRDALFFRLAGVRRIVGTIDKGSMKHGFDAATGLHEPYASLLARSIAELGDADPSNIANWDLHLSAAEKDTARQVLAPLEGKPLIVCGPGTKMQTKDWGQDNWQALIGRLYSRFPNYGLVTIGVEQESQICDFASLPWAGSKVNLAGKLSPRESAAVIAHAEVFIGPDSGPMHLASSVGVPSVCVFSSIGLPGEMYPFGSRNRVIYHRVECMGCHLLECIEMKKKCILSITVDEMESAILAVLSNTDEPAPASFAGHSLGGQLIHETAIAPATGDCASQS